VPKTFLTALAILIAAAASADDPPAVPQRPAQQKPAQQKPAEQRPVQPIEELARGSFASRQRATLEMWRDRESSREKVQAATRHPDPEVAGRAQWILRQWRRGAVPGTPPHISRLLADARGGPALERLLIAGQFDAAWAAVEESAGTLPGETTRKRIADALRTRFPFIVRAAVSGGRLPELLEFVSAVADSKELAVCRIELMQALEVEIDFTQLLPLSADSWTAAERDQALTLILLRLGQDDQALDVARQSGDRELLFRCRAITGRWSEAATRAAEQARQAEPGSAAQTRAWSRTMICADRGGRQELFSESREALAAEHTDNNAQSLELRWRALASHGDVDAALKMLARQDAESAALLAIDASRPAIAFESLGVPLDRGEDAAVDFVDRAIATQAGSGSGEVVEELDQAFALIRCLLAIGRERTARAAVRRICASDIELGALRLRDFALSTLSVTRGKEWMAEFAIAEDEKMISTVSRAILARSLPDCDPAAFDLVFQSLEKADPKRSVRERVDATCALFRGEQPEGFDPQAEFKELYDLAVSPRRPIRGIRGSLRDLKLNLNVVRLFVRHGQSDYASDCLRRLVVAGNLEALQMLIDQELAAGSGESALALLDQLYESALRGDQGETGDSQSRDLIAMRSLIGQWTIAGRLGDHLLADQLWTEIRLSLCAPSLSFRAGVAEYLAAQDQIDTALDAYEAILPMVALGGDESIGVYEVARNYSLLAQDHRVDQAARWFDLAICESINSGNYRAGAYVTLPLFVRRWLVEAALQQGDRDAVEQHLERIAKLDPLDIDLAERILPKLRRSGMAEVADRALERILTAGLKHAEKFPNDAMTANNLAWVAAMNDTRLSDALRLSRQAVYREPESAIYRDTLAEILFRLGRHEEALQVEQACLLDDPTQWLLHKQVEKYGNSLAR